MSFQPTVAFRPPGRLQLRFNGALRGLVRRILQFLDQILHQILLKTVQGILQWFQGPVPTSTSTWSRI